jgi:glycosyltransferase involved in cell wall biosynthesis
VIRYLDQIDANESLDQKNPDISVIVPIYNEVESLPHLVEAIATTMREADLNYEIICVDDGSTDGSTELLKELASNRQDLQGIILRRNYGQTPAMAAGFDYGKGKVMITLDADLQNDPADKGGITVSVFNTLTVIP